VGSNPTLSAIFVYLNASASVDFIDNIFI
jgi:hypothetical protein